MNVFIAKVNGTEGYLTAEESWHCCKVLRKKAGDAVQLIDGIGNFFEARLEQISEKQTIARITSGPVKQREKPYSLHLAIAPTKQIDRIEWMVEKAVEIGIDEISFVICKNSERAVIKTDRIVKIVESAVKQSLQARIPKVNDAMAFKDLLKVNAGQKFIAHCYQAQKRNLKEVNFKIGSSLVMIGPEGDFTREEVTMAELAGFQPISLGENRLRTETAGLYVCQAAALLTDY